MTSSFLTVTDRRTGATVLLALLLLCLYTAWLTKNHYWDGIGFALNIEGVPQNSEGHYFEDSDRGKIYFNPNHLLYNAAGRWLYQCAKFFNPALRALPVLVAWSIASAILTACLVQRLLFHFTGRLALSFTVALTMSLTATWWKFSTDANTYVPGTFLLTLSAYLLARGQSTVLAALSFAAAMLLHQIAICFAPAAAALLWWNATDRTHRQKRIGLLVYFTLAFLIVAIAYVRVWFAEAVDPWNVRSFLAWLTFNGSDVYEFPGFLANLGASFLSFVRLLFGGKLRLALAHAPLPLLAVLVPACLAGFFLAIRHWRARIEPLLPAHWFLIAWCVSYFAFLFFWLTTYPYYRLFCLPAIALTAGLVFRQVSLKAWAGLALTIGCANFALYIYPYSKVEASPPLAVALSARENWPENPIIFYENFHCDNWWVSYFNPKADWIQASKMDPERLLSGLQTAVESGRTVLLDTSLLDRIQANENLLIRLREIGSLGEPWGLRNAKHNIQFVPVRNSSDE